MRKVIGILFSVSLFCFKAEAQSNTALLLQNINSVTLDSASFDDYMKSVGKLRDEYPDSFIFYHQKAIDFCRKNHLFNYVVGCFSNLTAAEAERGNFELALSFSDSTLKYNSFSNAKNSGSIIMQRANIFNATGRYEQAMTEYTKALSYLDEQTNPRDICMTYSNMIYLLCNAGKPKLALEYCEKEMRLAEKYKKEIEIGWACVNFSQCYIDMKMIEKARPYILRLYEIAVRKNDLDLKGSAFNNRGILSMYDRDYVAAVEFYKQAMKINQKLNDHYTLCNTYNNLASAYHKLNQLDEAKKYLELALPLSFQIGARESRKGTYQLIADIEADGNDFKSAFRYTQILLKLNDSLLNEKSQQQILDLEAKYKSEQIKLEKEMKEQQVVLLQKDNALKQIRLNKKVLDSLEQEMEISLLNKDKEIGQLELSSKDIELNKQKLVAQANAAKIELLNKDKKLREQNLLAQKRLQLFLAISFLGLLIMIGLLFTRYQLKKKIEKQEALLAERSRISHDMHDDLGSSLSKIAFLSESVVQNSNTEQIKTQVQKISSSAREAIEKTGEIVWSLNPQNDSLENLISYLRKYTAEYFEHTGVECHFNLPNESSLVRVSGEQRRNLLLAVKEALQNVMKHADATRLNFSIIQKDRHIEISIHDNGKGIDLSHPQQFSNGLKTMKQRTESGGGYFSVENGNGTTVRLGMKLV